VHGFDLCIFFCIDVLEKDHKVFFFLEVIASVAGVASVAAIVVEIHSTYQVLVVGTDNDIFFLDVELFAVESYTNDVAIAHPTQKPIYFLLIFWLKDNLFSFYCANKCIFAKDTRHLYVVAKYNFVEVK
jgi:hypothetical protein